MEKIKVPKTTDKTILSVIDDCGNCLYEAKNSITKYVSKWYFAYTLTEEYKNLKTEAKQDIFNHFEEFNFLLDNLDTYLWHNKKGEYSNTPNQ